MKVILPLLLCVLVQVCDAAFVVHRQAAQRRPLHAMDTDEQERWKQHDTQMRKEFRVEFDHDDWVDYRTKQRFNDMQDLYLPCLAVLVIFVFYVAVSL